MPQDSPTGLVSLISQNAKNKEETMYSLRSRRKIISDVVPLEAAGNQTVRQEEQGHALIQNLEQDHSCCDASIELKSANLSFFPGRNTP